MQEKGGFWGEPLCTFLGTFSPAVAVLFRVLLDNRVSLDVTEAHGGEGRTALPGRRAQTAGEELED